MVVELEDIRKAIDLIKEESIPLIKQEYEWGWIESDCTGTPITIGLNKQTHAILLDFMELTTMEKAKIKNSKIGKLYGIDVFITEGDLK